MKRSVVLDTGPLVALLSARDPLHAWAVEQWARIEPPLMSCEAVFSEACFLLRSTARGDEAVLGLLRRGVIKIGLSLTEEAAAIERLISKYRDVPMALADACVVQLAEKLQSPCVFTIDGHFDIYRMHGRRVIPTLQPPVT